MILSNKKLRKIADLFGLLFTLLVIHKIKNHGNKQLMIDQINNWKPIWRTKTLPFKIVKWYANK